MISWENYEEYMMMHADGELQPAEVQELMVFIDTNPSLKSELAMYELTRLSPDESLVYNDKKSLLKSEPAKRTIAFPQWRKYSIAAGIALIIAFSLFKYKEANKNNGDIVRVYTAKKALPQPKNNEQTTSDAKRKQDQPNIAVAPIQPVKVMPIAYSGKHRSTIPNKQIADQKQEDIAVVNKDTPVKIITEISSLSIINTNPMPSEITQVSPPMVAIPAYEISTYNKPEKRSFIDRLPIDDANKRQLKTIAHITSEASRSVSKVKEEIDGNAITLNIHNNNVHISF